MEVEVVALLLQTEPMAEIVSITPRAETEIMVWPIAEPEVVVEPVEITPERLMTVVMAVMVDQVTD